MDPNSQLVLVRFMANLLALYIRSVCHSILVIQSGTREDKANVGAMLGFYQPASHEATSSSSTKATTLLDKTR